MTPGADPAAPQAMADGDMTDRWERGPDCSAGADEHQPAAARALVRLAPPVAFLAGREELLADLGARLSGDAGQRPPVVAMYGPGGTGKTSAAVEYAHRHLAGSGLVWQLTAEDPAALAAGFSELAAQLTARLGPGDRPDAAEPVARVHDVLADRLHDWLLVFDNAPGPAAIQELLPTAGRGRVLITSQNPYWAAGQALEVPVLDQDVATAFLLSRTGAADNDSAKELAAELGGLPLALEQAAAYIQATGRTIAEFLEVFRAQQSELPARRKAADSNIRVTTTWALAFGELQRTMPQAAGLLQLLACCAPGPIPVRLLLQPRPGLAESFGPDVAPLLLPLLEHRHAADKALAALRRYSLISPSADGSVSVHELVQAATIGQLPAKQAEVWLQAAWSLTEAALPGGGRQPGHPAVLKHAPEARQRPAGADDPHVLAARASLANLIGQVGDPAGARDQYAALLGVLEQVLGADHADTLAARGDLAYWAGTAGNPAGARDQYAAMLPVLEHVLGAEHPDTLATRGDLARWTGTAGDPAGARELFAALLPVLERALGAEHPDTLAARGDLAYWAGTAGDPAGARDQFAALLPVRERVLGAGHPDTLAARSNLTYWAGAAGDPAQARDQFAALLPVLERSLGAGHPDALTARSNLAYWAAEAGDPARARDECSALLAVLEGALGAENLHTLATRSNLARWAGEAGDPAAARDQFAALLPVLERVLGADHPDTLATRGSLAYWTRTARGNTAD